MPILDWHDWCENDDGTVTANNLPYTLTWNTSSTTTTNPYLWTNWGNSTITSGSGSNWYPLVWRGQRLVIAEEEWQQAFTEIEAVADDVANRERLRVEREQYQRSRTQAIARGEALLLEMLDENQREAYRFDGTFTVIGSHGTIYRIKRGTSGNIEWIKPDGTVGGRLCAHPTMHHEWLPTEDVMLAQMLALTHDEREFCRVANVHAGTRPPMAMAA